MILVAIFLGAMFGSAAGTELLVFAIAGIALMPMLSSLAVAALLTLEHKTGRAVIPAHRRMIALGFCVSLFYAIPPSLIPGGGGFLLAMPLILVGVTFLGYLAVMTLRKDAPTLDRRCSSLTVGLAWALGFLALAIIICTHILTWGHSVPMVS